MRFWALQITIGIIVSSVVFLATHNIWLVLLADGIAELIFIKPSVDKNTATDNNFVNNLTKFYDNGRR